MNKNEFNELGWQFKADAFQSWVFQNGNFTLQFLYDKKVAYIAQDAPTDIQAQVIYRGRMESQNMLFDVMELLFIPTVLAIKEPQNTDLMKAPATI